MQPILCSLARAERFAQTVSPWTGEEGFTEAYSPAILCLLDYVERLCGILPRPDGEIWFTGLLPSAMDHGEEVTGETAYARSVDRVLYELVNLRDKSVIYREGQAYMKFPSGIRVITDREGSLRGILGMSVRTVDGRLEWEGRSIPFSVKGNEYLKYGDGELKQTRDAGIVYPTYS